MSVRTLPATHAGQNLGLNVVRSGAILAVLLSHTMHWFMGPGPQADVRAAYIGAAGVEVFFSLSGFLIGGVLLRALDRGFTPAVLGEFWWRRWMRTVPAYWAVVGGLSWWFGVWHWPSLVFMQNFTPRTTWPRLAVHTWSLVVEEWFYLFVPLLLLGAVTVLRRCPAWLVPALCLSLVALCTAGRWSIPAYPEAGDLAWAWGPDPTINPVLRLDCASWGVLAAWWARRQPGAAAGRAAAWWLLAAGVGGLVGLGAVSGWTYTPERLMPWGYAHWARPWFVGSSTLVQVAGTAAILGLHALLPRGRGLLAAAAGGTARLSYALYLVHVPVLYLGRAYGMDDLTLAGQAQAVLLVVGAALLLRHGVERPALWLRDRTPARPG